MKSKLRERSSSDSMVEKRSLADLYAGPGGLSFGFKSSGFFQPIVAVELNAKVAETYANNLSAKVIRGDVTTVKPEELLKVAKEQGFEGIDIVVGGPLAKLSRQRIQEKRNGNEFEKRTR